MADFIEFFKCSNESYVITRSSVIGILLFYGALFVVIRSRKRWIEREERKTFRLIALAWAIPVLVANILLWKTGQMSCLPLENNFLHSFVWIGGCLSWLYLAIREQVPIVTQCVIFATFSLVVKVFEQQLFGTWDHGFFFFELGFLNSNAAYVIGWSLADGLYPLLTLYGLRLLGRRMDGLVVL